MKKFLEFVREHPYASAIVLIGTTAGAGCALYFEIGPADMSPVARGLGGAIAGFYFSLFPLGTRLFD